MVQHAQYTKRRKSADFARLPVSIEEAAKAGKF